MDGDNKRNLLYFEGDSMQQLYDTMEQWQIANSKRLLSLNIQQDSGRFCCIALTNPTEVVLTSSKGTPISTSTRGGTHMLVVEMGWRS